MECFFLRVRLCCAVLSCAVLMLLAPAIVQAGENVTYGFVIPPLEMPVALDVSKVRLGEKLFHDVRLSGDNSISCAHCHALSSGGADALPHSFGVNGAEGGVNTPTVYNADRNLAQFWDGRAATLEDQIDGPTHNPVEMASNWKQIIQKLSADADVVRDFNRIYHQYNITAHHIKDAIATFERSLVSINSPFDRFIQGDEHAISDNAKSGFELFQGLGCISCHQGTNVGGNMYQKMGVFSDYFKQRKDLTKADLGRFNVTGRVRDKHKFKVPSLRLVVWTAPYFHDGTVKTLPRAVRLMAKYQLGRSISNEDVRLIVAFLRSLAGDLYKENKEIQP